MQQNEQMWEKYRQKLLKTYIWITASIVLLEIVIYVWMTAADLESKFFDSYILSYIVIPCAINSLLVFIMHRINASERNTTKFKNAATIYGLELMALNVACIHSYFYCVPVALCLPVLISTIYGDRVLMRNTAILSVIFLGVSLMWAWYIERPGDIILLFNDLVILLIICISYAIGSILNQFELETRNQIRVSAIRQQQLEQQLKTDQMTGLLNHTSFYRRLFETIDAATINSSPLSLAVIDLDNFKVINDTHGHENGNTVLITFARIMESCCDSTDIICRYGGEEFTIIFPGKRGEQALKTARQILDVFRQTEFDFMEEHVTFSCGICHWRPGLTPNDVFNQADMAMYEAKKRGKNRCILK